MKNQCNFIGRLTRDPILKGTAENPVCFMTLAVNRRYSNQQGEREADFIPLKAFKGKKLATTCHENLEKGSLISVTAIIRTKIKEGKTEIEIIAEDVAFLETIKKKQTNENGHNSSYSNEQEENSRYQESNEKMPWE